MPLFEIGKDELIPFRRVPVGPELYEEEIEQLLWSNLEALTDIPLFPVARQASTGDGLRPDIVALDEEGHVHVIEVKRNVDRGQLAQCLEYAGWARGASLDELAALFKGGPQEFFSAWTEFTESNTPRLMERPPRLVLVARDFDDRTESALTFLIENDLPITILRVTLYENSDGRRFVDVGAEHEAESLSQSHPDETRPSPVRYEVDGRRIVVADLLEAGMLRPGEVLTWERPKKHETYRARVLEDGEIELEDGRVYASPSRAAIEAAGIPAYDGWHAWRTEGGSTLGDLRQQLIDLPVRNRN